MKFEAELNSRGYSLVAGTDEAGRGPLAGPVAAAAVIMPPGLIIEGVDDSKKLSAKKREYLSARIKEAALCYAITKASVEEIDEINILRAALLAMSRAVKALTPAPDALIVDGTFAPEVDGVFIKCLPHGDSLSPTVAAASILAKVYRDALMDRIHEEYPVYGFNKHKGYGTPAHLKALREYGPCPAHRRSFKPINLLGMS